MFSLGATYLRVTGKPDTLIVILANTNFDAAVSGTTGPYVYIYYLSNDARDETYVLTPIGIYFGHFASDPENWFTWFVVGKNVSTAAVKIGAPYPNPLIVGGPTTMSIPVGSSRQISGTLSIFTSSMDLIYSSQLLSTPLLSGQQGFVWGATTNKGKVAQSGIYYFVLELAGERHSGKFAIVRK